MSGPTRPSPVVLRNSLFRNVHPRHDLEPANDGRLKAIHLGRCRLALKDTVNAIADFDAGCLRFDMNIASTALDRFDQNRTAEYPTGPNSHRLERSLIGNAEHDNATARFRAYETGLDFEPGLAKHLGIVRIL